MRCLRIAGRPGTPLGRRGVARAGWQLAVLAAVATSVITLIAALVARHGFLFDFRGDLFNAGRDILHGHNPYRAGYLAHLAHAKQSGDTRYTTFAVPVYPAPVLVAATPFSLLPFWLAGGLFLGLSVGAIILGLRLLGVRDWRCIALALVSWPCMFGLWLGTLGAVLLLGAAVAWHVRGRAVASAGALAGIFVAKLFPWPLLIWPLIARRARVAVLAAIAALTAVLAGWALVGFAGLVDYPQMLSHLAFVEQNAGASLTAALNSLGLDPSASRTVALLAAAVVIGLAWRVTRRPGGERPAFGLLVIAALVASPLVWEHYMVLLFVPIALCSARLSPLWFVPALGAIVPTPNAHAPAEMLLWVLLPLIVTGALLHAAARLQTGRRDRPAAVEPAVT